MTMEWMPRAATEVAEGCVWLPRMLDKARRLVESERAGRDMLSPYMFGDDDPADAELMRFLHADQAAVLALLRQEPDNDRAAAELVQRSGRSPEECAAWSARFHRRLGFLIAVVDADEGRSAPGVRTAALRFFYNWVLMPPIYWLHRRDPHRQLGHGQRLEAQRAAA